MSRLRKEDSYIIKTENGKQFDYEAIERTIRTTRKCPFSFLCPDKALEFDSNDVAGCLYCLEMFKERTQSNVQTSQ